jgi:hypothetical protein
MLRAMSWRRWLACCLGGGLGGIAFIVNDAFASSIESADIRFMGSSYHYRFSALVDAPADAVRDIVTDYERLLDFYEESGLPEYYRSRKSITP